MLDKETLLRQDTSLSHTEESLEDFLSCLEKAKDINASNENLQSCIEKILESFEEDE